MTSDRLLTYTPIVGSKGGGRNRDSRPDPDDHVAAEGKKRKRWGGERTGPQRSTLQAAEEGGRGKKDTNRLYCLVVKLARGVPTENRGGRRRTSHVHGGLA